MRVSHTSTGGTSPPSSACRPCSGCRGRLGRCRSRAGCSWTAVACGAPGPAWPCWTRCCQTCCASSSGAGHCLVPTKGEPSGGRTQMDTVARTWGKKEKTSERPSTTISEEPEPEPEPEPKPDPNVLQGEDIQALAIKVEDLEKVHAPRLPHDAGRIPVRRNYLVRKYRPKEVTHLVAHPASPRAPRQPLTFPGPKEFADGCEEILPHHILGSVQEFKMEVWARRSARTADVIEVPRPDVTAAALKEKHGGEKKKKAPQAQLAGHRALQNWSHHMAIRKKQEKHLGEILQKPENELMMNIAENYRQVMEERDLIDRSLPYLHPGKGYRVGSEFWSQPDRVGDELTGLTLTLTRTERGDREPITHVGKPRTVQKEMALKPPTKIPCHLTWDKSLFLKHRRQELKSVLEELGFYKPDLEGLELIGKGQPFTSVSAEASPCSASPCSTPSEETDSDSCNVAPEEEKHLSLVFCGKPARWIKGMTSCRNEIGVAARLTFETLAGEEAESFLTVSNDGTAAIWYSWMRLPQQIPSRETEGRRMPCFYFDTRPGVILPGETRRFSFLFKSRRAGIFSEPWEFRTHPLLLGGALLQVTLWGIAVYEDKLADFRENLESDLAAREGAAIVKDNLNELLDQVRTPERTPSPAYATEEELFHRKNPGFYYQYQVVKQLHELWRQYMTVPSAFEEKVLSDQRSTAEEDTEYQESTVEPLPAQSSTTELPGGKKSLEEAPRQKMSIEEEEAGPSGWNLSLEDFKQAIMSIPREEQREEALTQLNKAALELCVEQRPVQSDLLYPLCLQLWRGAVDDMVSHALRLRSLYGLLKKDTYADAVPEEMEEVKQGGEKKGGKEDKTATKKEEKKDKERKKSRATPGKEKVEHQGSRKLKAKDEKRTSSVASVKVKEGAEHPKVKDEKRVSAASSLKEKEGAVTTEGVESPQEQVDSVSFGIYQEKLYIEVYKLLDSMVSEMVSLFEDLKQ
ncbi:MYCBP-associated protein isoform X1 [Neopelma chrysocephalum]|uniref:MYCBP-associated protein isoform X1 n=1 Tax=Neopelma chrysocephalum TaxID=114329 RepID=UPI000FCD3BC1|nr:MYCBP-associated protein isoform X1 [Neopelma chrysocephalum]